MTPSTTAARGAEVILIPPPAFFGLAFGAGMLLERARPLPIDLGPAAPALPAALLVAGAGLVVAGIVEVVRHRTTIVPHHPVSTLVTTGVYRVSRNPMYTGLGALLAGGALAVGSWWPLLLLPLVLLVVRRLVIDKEERYLTERFDQAYRDYQAIVRRWL